VSQTWSRVIAAFAGLELAHCVVVDLLMLCLWKTMLGIAFDRRLLAIAPVWALFALIAVLNAGIAQHIEAVALFVGFAAVAVVWRTPAKTGGIGGDPVQRAA